MKNKPFTSLFKTTTAVFLVVVFVLAVMPLVITGDVAQFLLGLAIWIGLTVYCFLTETKREKALYRFAHSSYEMINEKFKNTSLLEIQNFISSSFNEREDCYVISGNIHDKKNMSLKNAFFQFCNSDMMMIIICKNWVFIKEESVENKYYYTDSFN